MNTLQKLQSLGCNSCNGLPLVVAAPTSPHQPLSLEAVHEPGYIGGALDHALRDLTARMSLRINTSQDAKHVVLRTSEAVPFADNVHEIVNSAGSHYDAQQSFLLGAGEARLLKTATERFGHPVCYSQKSACCHTGSLARSTILAFWPIGVALRRALESSDGPCGRVRNGWVVVLNKLRKRLHKLCFTTVPHGDGDVAQ